MGDLINLRVFPGTAANVLTPAPAATTAVVAPMSSMGMGLGGAQPPSTNAGINPLFFTLFLSFSLSLSLS